MSKRIICIIGNPNCGKTTLFNAMTGSRQRVGNWPGVTVDKKTGFYTYRNDTFELVDLPGIYSITPSSAAGEDERVARDYILSNEAEAVINIVDASNLERNLYLTGQLIEMQVPMIVVVNMLDVAAQQHMKIDLDALRRRLGCPVIGLIASKSDGIAALKNTICDFVANPSTPELPYRFDPKIAEAASRIGDYLCSQGVARGHWYGTQFMEQAPGVKQDFAHLDLTHVDAIVETTDRAFDQNTDLLIANTRYDWAYNVAEDAIERTALNKETMTERIDKIVLNRWLGFPIFLAIMYLLFLFTQNLGGAFIDFFDILVGGIMVDGLGQLLGDIGAPQWLTVFLANGIGGGLQTVSTFIPVVFFLFLFLALLEESGYMARGAFVMDRLMRSLGLPGKAFVPMLVGFGCTVPAIMATRTMDRASDRIITVLMAPFMSCGARLPVYVLFAAAFFPQNGQNLVFGLYLIGILAAVFTGFLLKRSALTEAASACVMEIPLYHVPTVKSVLYRTWDRLKSFVMRAGRVIIVIVAGLAFLNSLGTDGSFGNEDTDKSALSAIGRTIVPAFEPMGVRAENWPAAVGIFTGIFAKEAVVGTLDSLYESMNAKNNAAEGEAQAETNEGFSLSAVVTEAAATVSDNLAGLGGALLDPLGLTVNDMSDTEAAAQEQGVHSNTIALIQAMFGSSAAAFAYLLLILLYMPCVAAMGTIYRELGRTWTIFAGVWTSVLAYSVATVFYQVATFTVNPVYSLTWITLCSTAVVGMYLWMKRMSVKNVGPKRIRIVSVNA
ncbi:MAG: Fe(2+) transporter permease subunit FeoB [Duodenibacillus sp.]|nr:Fe(2+) transporter permease subunit FeoB [Duodenibacillus sp.]